MSRIGKQPILVPEGVNVIIEDLSVQVKGPKGALSVDIHKDMNLDLKDNTLLVSRPSDDRLHKSLHGTTRMILMNCINGVSDGFEKELEIVDHPEYEGEKQAKNMWTYSDTKIVPLLVKAVQELSEQNKVLEKRIEQLEK